MTLAQGDPFVVGDIFSFQQANRIKDNWRAAAAPTSPQAGSLWSDSVNNLFKHRQTTAWKEILQADTPLSDEAQIIIGTNSDFIAFYDEATNDALILGIPFNGKRGVIICNADKIGEDYTAEILTAIQPRLNLIDADGDSAMAIGFWGDDLPGIMARHHPFNINWDGEQDVHFFAGSETGENRYAYIFGFKTGDVIRYIRERVRTDGYGELDAELGFFLSVATSIRMSMNGTGLSFFGVTPVARQAHITDPTDLPTCITAITSILSSLENYGLLNTV